MSIDERIDEFLDDKPTVPHSVKLQKKIVDRFFQTARKKYGAIQNLKAEATRYFLLRGILDWEDAHREDGDKKNFARHPKAPEIGP